MTVQLSVILLSARNRKRGTEVCTKEGKEIQPVATRSRKVTLQLRQDGRYPATMETIFNASVARETSEPGLKELQKKVWQLVTQTQRLEKCVVEAEEKIEQ
jgi:hypothetical protein